VSPSLLNALVFRAVPSSKLAAVPFRSSVRFSLLIEHQNHAQNTSDPLRCQENSRAKCSEVKSGTPYPVRYMLVGMKIPADVKAAMTEIARKFGRQGGKKSAAILTAEERLARAKKASTAAAKKRTADRLERERAAKKRK
jgi:hypothetical protein